MAALKEPVNTRYYHPVERPRRYPLELEANHNICLWSEDGKFKWTVAYFARESEGYELRFVGDRPLDARVNWEHFRELVILGQRLADEKWDRENRST